MAGNKTEVRTFRSSSNLRAMSQGDEGSMVIAGRALSYNTLSGDLGGFKEVLVPGCFSRSIASGRIVKCLREHQDGFLLGSTKDGSLTLQDSAAGLDFSCKIDPADPIAVSTRAAIKAGKIDSMSFAFVIDGDDGDAFTSVDDQRTGQKYTVRSINRAFLLDVSPVFSPAYPVGTSVQARKVDYCITPVSDQAPIRAQIAAWESRQRQRLTDARSIAAEYPELSIEEILRAKTLGYSEDAMLQLRSAAISRTIRQGAFEVGAPSPRYSDGGSAQDPQCLLRGDDDFDPSDASDKDEHERAADYHRACARKASTMARGVEHFKAADAHQLAAGTGDPNDSIRARAASKELL